MNEVLCKPVYNYKIHWSPSATHILPNTIKEAEGKVVNIDLLGKIVILECIE